MALIYSTHKENNNYSTRMKVCSNTVERTAGLHYFFK